MPETEDITRFGQVKLNDDGRIVDFDEGLWYASSIHLLWYLCDPQTPAHRTHRTLRRRRPCGFVRDILVRYKNLKRICLNWIPTGATLHL